MRPDAPSGTPLRAEEEIAPGARNPQAGRLCFDRFVLDLARGALLQDEGEIALRPKTLAVVHHLVENAGDGSGAGDQPERRPGVGPAGETPSLWSGQTDAAVQSPEPAQRLDLLDRFALSLAYYLEGRYDAAIDEAERTLRQNPGANFSRIVLAAAHAEADRGEEVARVIPAIQRSTRPSIPTHSAGNF
jgi:hypothetical protein